MSVALLTKVLEYHKEEYNEESQETKETLERAETVSSSKMELQVNPDRDLE
jgi:hypothetical protein